MDSMAFRRYVQEAESLGIDNKQPGFDRFHICEPTPIVPCVSVVQVGRTARPFSGYDSRVATAKAGGPVWIRPPDLHPAEPEPNVDPPCQLNVAL